MTENNWTKQDDLVFRQSYLVALNNETRLTPIVTLANRLRREIRLNPQMTIAEFVMELVSEVVEATEDGNRARVLEAISAQAQIIRLYHDGSVFRSDMLGSLLRALTARQMMLARARRTP